MTKLILCLLLLFTTTMVAQDKRAVGMASHALFRHRQTLEDLTTWKLCSEQNYPEKVLVRGIERKCNERGVRRKNFVAVSFLEQAWNMYDDAEAALSRYNVGKETDVNVIKRIGDLQSAMVDLRDVAK